MRESTDKQMDNGQDGYGYLFWRGAQNSFRCDGKYGQYGIVLPDRNTVIAVNAECTRQRELLKLIEQTLFNKL